MDETTSAHASGASEAAKESSNTASAAASARGSAVAVTPPVVSGRLGPTQLASTYRLIAELLLYPEDRDGAAIEGYRRALAEVPEVTEPIDAFMASPRARDLDEYLMLLELAPTCPLYLGTYMFEEPSSCRGAGLSDRNAYMIELKAIYRHFGFEPAGSEMADFLPLIADFLALALEHASLDEIGLRRRLLELHVAPALTPLREKLEKYESPYAGLIACMARMVEHDASTCPEPVGEGAGALELPMLKPFIRSTAGDATTPARAPQVGVAEDASAVVAGGPRTEAQR